MKRILLFLMLVGVVFVLSGVVQAGADIQMNGGFEDAVEGNTNNDGDPFPDGWGSWNSGGHDWGTYVTDDPDNAFAGDDYMSQTTTWGYGLVDHHDHFIGDIPVGTDITIKVMVRKAPGAADGSMFISFFFMEDAPRNTGGRGSEPSSESMAVTSESWEEFEFTAPIPDVGDPTTRNGNAVEAGVFSTRPMYASTTLGIDGGDTTFWYDRVLLGVDPSLIPMATNPNFGPSMMGVNPDDVNAAGLTWTQADITEAEFAAANPLLDVVEVDVYFDTNQALVEERDSGSKLNLAGRITDEAIMPPTVGTDAYYWLVESFAIDTDGGEPDMILGGDVWWFDTANAPPSFVDAGASVTKWFTETTTIASRKVYIQSTVVDDGMPGTGLIYTVACPGSNGAYMNPAGHPEGTIEIRFGVAASGVYEVTLDVQDSPGGEIVSDNAFITVVQYGDAHLEAHWDLDDGSGTVALDASGNLHVGTGTSEDDLSNPTALAAGQIGTSFDFDAAAKQYVEIEDSGYGTDPNFAGLMWADGSVGLTVSCWMKSATTDGSETEAWAGIVSKDSQSWEMTKGDTANSVTFAVKNEVGAAGTDGGLVNTLPFDGGWHHIVATYDGNDAKMYIDGMLADSNVAAENQMTVGPGNIVIGRTQNCGNTPEELNLDESTWFRPYFAGSIDDVRIYDIAIPHKLIAGTLSPSVQDLYITGGGLSNCGSVYAATDLNQDCYHDIYDVIVLAQAWLDCNDVINQAQCN